VIPFRDENGTGIRTGPGTYGYEYGQLNIFLNSESDANSVGYIGYLYLSHAYTYRISDFEYLDFDTVWILNVRI